MRRPTCEWRNGEDCRLPATWMVGFVNDYRFHMSCEGHVDKWNKAGRGCYIAEIKGFQPQTTIEEIFAENQARAAERE
jgi:hypothetical protein